MVLGCSGCIIFVPGFDYDSRVGMCRKHEQCFLFFFFFFLRALHVRIGHSEPLLHSLLVDRHVCLACWFQTLVIAYRLIGFYSLFFPSG